MRNLRYLGIGQGILGASLALALVACSGSDGGSSNVSISSQPLAGKIGGQAWTLGAAETSPMMSDTESYWVDMYGESVAACANGSSTLNSLIVLFPPAAGDYSLGMNQAVTFYLEATSDNLVATSGKIHIDSITATTITGGLHATYNADNEVDGQFQVTICP